MIALLTPVYAAAAEGEAADGLFFEPSFLVSTFTTDKGELEREASFLDESYTWDVHTGDFNWIIAPGFAVGYGWGRWTASFRAVYPLHRLYLNLPYDRTANGLLHSLELGPEIGFRVFTFSWTTVDAQLGFAYRPIAMAKLDYGFEDRSDAEDTRTLNGLPGQAGFAFTFGAGGDLMRDHQVLLGWVWRFYWGRYELEREVDNIAVQVDYEGQPGEAIDVFDEEHLQLNVYSAMLGVRLRIYPMAPRGGQ